MACAGQNVLHAWHPTHPRPMKYIFIPLLALVTVTLASIVAAVLVSAVFAAAIAPAAFKSIGDAIAAELSIMNFLLVKFELFSVIKLLLLPL